MVYNLSTDEIAGFYLYGIWCCLKRQACFCTQISFSIVKTEICLTVLCSVQFSSTLCLSLYHNLINSYDTPVFCRGRELATFSLIKFNLFVFNDKQSTQYHKKQNIFNSMNETFWTRWLCQWWQILSALFLVVKWVLNRIWN